MDEMGQESSRLAALGAVRPQSPVWFRLESGDPLMALHAEVKGGGLAGAVGHDAGIQVAVLALHLHKRWLSWQGIE